ncbi:MAG: thioesterase family protein [Pseudomonadota bacterium]
MPPPEQTTPGRAGSDPPAGFRHHLELRPRFIDLDAFGHVNNARFLTYFEEGRISYLRSLGIFAPPASRVSLVIAQAEVKYLHPILHRHVVQVHVRSQDWGRAQFRFQYAIWLPEPGALAATGSTQAVAWDLDRRKPTAIPPEFAEKMRAFEAGSACEAG